LFCASRPLRAFSPLTRWKRRGGPQAVRRKPPAALGRRPLPHRSCHDASDERPASSRTGLDREPRPSPGLRANDGVKSHECFEPRSRSSLSTFASSVWSTKASMQGTTSSANAWHVLRCRFEPVRQRHVCCARPREETASFPTLSDQREGDTVPAYDVLPRPVGECEPLLSKYGVGKWMHRGVALRRRKPSSSSTC
jgi:hypothetical protein